MIVYIYKENRVVHRVDAIFQALVQTLTTNNKQIGKVKLRAEGGGGGGNTNGVEICI